LSTYENVRNWFLNSGIVLSNQNDENYGAVHSFFDQDNNRYGFLYPEITGYSVSAFCFLYHIEKDDRFIKLAKASSNWLIELYEKYGAIIQGLEPDNDSRTQIAYSFDTAICAKGLIDCFTLTQDKRFLKYSKDLVNWLKGAITNQGSIYPYLELKSKKFNESNQLWYKKWGCLHIKTSIPLIQLYQITHDNSYLNLASKICNTFSKFQNIDGSFSLHENVQTINLHTMCYALEGLFYYFSVIKNDEYLQSIETALDWCTKQIQNDGSIELWFNSKYKSKAVYPIAQLIRIMFLLDKFHNTKKYQTYINKLHSFMLTLQVHDNNPKVYGGFYEEYYKSMFGWKKRKKLNSWGSLFALQALYWYENYDTINFESISYLY
jgi:hypothetical protein